MCERKTKNFRPSSTDDQAQGLDHFTPRYSREAPEGKPPDPRREPPAGRGGFVLKSQNPPHKCGWLLRTNPPHKYLRSHTRSKPYLGGPPKQLRCVYRLGFAPCVAEPSLSHTPQAVRGSLTRPPRSNQRYAAGPHDLSHTPQAVRGSLTRSLGVLRPETPHAFALRRSPTEGEKNE